MGCDAEFMNHKNTKRIAEMELEISELKKSIKEAIEYCEPNTQFMWAAKVVSLLTGCDFRDSDQAAKEWLYIYNEGK